MQLAKQRKAADVSAVFCNEFLIEVKDRRGHAENTAMERISTNNIGDTIRIRKPPRVFTNEKGATIWMSEVEPVELEIELDRLVSTDPYDSWRSVSD